MDWNQIETKWAVMARRIRADVPMERTQDRIAARRLSGNEDMRASMANEAVVGKIEITRKRNPVSMP